MTPPPTRMVAVAGPSGSGKSTLARAVAAAEPGAVALSCDSWYRDRSALPPAAREALDYDHPEAIEWPLLLAQLRVLREGGSVRPPRYDFAAHTRRPEPAPPVGPARLVVLDGIHALHHPGVRALLDLAVYVHAPRKVCLARRLQRDTRERGRDEAEVRRRFREMVWPRAEEFVLPCRELVDLVVDGTAAVQAGVARIRAALATRLREPASPPPGGGA